MSPFPSGIDYNIEYLPSKKNGGKLLVVNGIRFFRNRKRGLKQYWKCSHYYNAEKCPSIIIINEESSELKILHAHQHEVNSLTTKSDTATIVPFKIA